MYERNHVDSATVTDRSRGLHGRHKGPVRIGQMHTGPMPDVELVARYSKTNSTWDQLRRLKIHLAKQATELDKRRETHIHRTHKLDQRLEPEVIAELVAAYESGVPTTQLTKTYGLSKGSVLKLLSEAGVTMRRQGLDESQIREAAGRYSGGASLASVAALYDCSAEHLRQALLAHGVLIRPRAGWSYDREVGA